MSASSGYVLLFIWVYVVLREQRKKGGRGWCLCCAEQAWREHNGVYKKRKAVEFFFSLFSALLQESTLILRKTKFQQPNKMSSTHSSNSENLAETGGAPEAVAAVALAAPVTNVAVPAPSLRDNSPLLHTTTGAEEEAYTETYYTRYGCLRYTTSTGKAPRVTFHNEKAKKTDIHFYLSSIRQLANALPLAQEAARKYQRCPSVIQLAIPVPGSAHEAASEGQQLLYFKELQEYGEEIRSKVTLTVSVFEGYTHIWLKPLWKNPNAEAGSNPWIPTFRGFQFSVKDSADGIMSFAERHLSLAGRQRQQQKQLQPNGPAPENLLIPEIN